MVTSKLWGLLLKTGIDLGPTLDYHTGVSMEKERWRSSHSFVSPSPTPRLSHFSSPSLVIDITKAPRNSNHGCGLSIHCIRTDPAPKLLQPSPPSFLSPSLLYTPLFFILIFFTFYLLSLFIHIQLFVLQRKNKGGFSPLRTLALSPSQSTRYGENKPKFSKISKAKVTEIFHKEGYISPLRNRLEEKLVSLVSSSSWSSLKTKWPLTRLESQVRFHDRGIARQLCAQGSAGCYCADCSSCFCLFFCFIKKATHRV